LKIIPRQLKLIQNDLNTRLNRADARVHIEEYDGAIEDYTQFINKNTEHTDAYFKRGYAYSLKQDFKAALADYNQVIKIDSSYALAYIKRGYIRKLKGQKKEAISDFKQAIAIFHNKSMLNEVSPLQQEIRTLKNEIQNTPWWQIRLF